VSTTGAPAAGAQVPAPAAQPTTPAPAPAVAPTVATVDPRDAEIAELRSRVTQYEPYARIGYEEFQKRSAAAPTAPAPAPTVKPIFNITPFDDNLKSFIDYDQAGRVIEKAGAPPGTAATYQRHVNDKAAALDQLLRDPAAVFAPLLEGIEAKAAEQAEKRLQGRVQQAQLCQLDSAGNPVQSMDPLTRETRFHFTPDGQAFLAQYQQLTRYGVPPQEAAQNAKAYVAFRRAEEAMRAGQIPGTPAPAPAPASPLTQTPGTPAADPKRTFLNSLPGGSPQGNQPAGDTLLPTGPNRSQSVRQFFIDRARAGGMQV